MGARGNSGVIISQMLRGFAHHLRHKREVDTFAVATAMKEAVAAAKQALLRPVDGTIISVAEAAAEAAYTAALKERDFYRFVTAVLRAANEALDRTPDQLPVLKEAGVVDSGGAGFVYFLEGILAFLPDVKVRATAFPRRPSRQTAFTPAQVVGENKYCTEFVLEGAKCSVVDLRRLLEPRGESLLVIGDKPTIKVHIHTDDPERVKEIAGRHGSLTRLKVDNMEQQHNVLVVEKPEVAYSIVSVVPGPGFERIVRELGTEVVVSGVKNPSVRDLLLAINKCLSNEIYLFVNDKNVALAAAEVVKLTEKHVHVIPSRDIVAGIAGLFAFRTTAQSAPSEDEIRGRVRTRAQRAGVFCRQGCDPRRHERRGRKTGGRVCRQAGRRRDLRRGREGGSNGNRSAVRRPDYALLRRRSKRKGCTAPQCRAGSGFSGCRRRILLRRYEERRILAVVR